MAVIKFINKEYKNFSDLRNLIKYVVKDGELIGLYNKFGVVEKADHIYEDFILTKLKDNPTFDFSNQCLHFVQKFDRKDELSLREAHEIAGLLVDRFYKFKNIEVLFATHDQTDQEHIHNHFVVNLSKVGNGLFLTKDDRIELRNLSDEICREYGLAVLKPFEEYIKEANGRAIR